MQKITGQLLLITAVSIVMKRELKNETVNYDTQTKTSEVKIWASSVSYQQQQQKNSEAAIRRCSSK